MDSVTGRIITSEPNVQDPTHIHRPTKTSVFANANLARIEERIAQFLCGITLGHSRYSVRRFEKNCMYLECIDCGHKSSGWSMR